MVRPELFDLLIIAVIAMLLFGANRIPAVARGIGAALREFKNGLAGKDTETKTDADKSPRS